MEYQYKLTPLAVSDIDEALDYISCRLLNPAAAEKLYHAILQEVKDICEGPFAFPDCSNYLIENSMIRHSIVGNYVLIFEVCEEEKAIHILRFLYGGMDIANMTIR